MEQPDIINKLINLYLPNGVLTNIPSLTKYDEIDIIACGSAYNVGLIGKYFLECVSNIKIRVVIASEYPYEKIHKSDKRLAIIISQSGETADTLSSLRLAKEHKMDILSIVNVVGSSIARESDMVLYTNAGMEIAVATTKAFMAQAFALYLLSLQFHSNIDMIRVLEIPKLIKEQLESFSEDILNLIENKEHLFFLGKSIDYYLCLEGSLKLKEISYIHSEAYPAGELKHGTISLIEENTPVIAIISDPHTAPKTISSIKEVKARGAKVILVVTNDLFEEGDYYDKKIVVKNNGDFNVLPIIASLQLIAYNAAKRRGKDIDKPRNLAKSVTV